VRWGAGRGWSEWLKRMTEVRAALGTTAVGHRWEKRGVAVAVAVAVVVARRPTLACWAGAAWAWTGGGGVIGRARLAPTTSAEQTPTVTSDSTAAAEGSRWIAVCVRSEMTDRR
jgi:hypothetical protein